MNSSSSWGSIGINKRPLNFWDPRLLSDGDDLSLGIFSVVIRDLKHKVMGAI